MVIRQIREWSIDDLIGLPVIAYLKKGLAIYQKAQEVLQQVAESDDSESVTKIKIGTTLTFAVLKKMANENVYPKDFTKEDWAEISATVKDVVVFMDGQNYSMFVFDLYADFIRASAIRLQNVAPEEKREDIFALADDLAIKRQQLQDGLIEEVSYTEECLWICFEAMIKSLSCMMYYTGDYDVAEFVQASTIFAFEYGRFVLYRKENALVTEYLENQRQLDAELLAKFETYKIELEAASNQFMTLIDNAFDPQFKASLHASVELARAAGVKEEDILKSVEDVDSFFMC